MCRVCRRSVTFSYATSLGSSRSSGCVAIDAGDIAPDLTTAPLVAALAAGDPTAELRAAGAVVLGSGAFGVVIRAEMTMRRVVAGAALECRLPCAVKTLWHVIASPYHIAGLISGARRLMYRDVVLCAVVLLLMQLR